MVVGDVDVWMVFVMVATDDVLGVGDSHAIHVVTGDLHHCLVGELIAVLSGEVQGDMTDRFADSGIEFLLSFKTLDNGVEDTGSVYQFGLLFRVEDVA